jgi:glycosyltransferase involved in cell wall biosynthesis
MKSGGIQDRPSRNREPNGRVLFIGSSYYNNWYASRELRARGWHADTLVTKGEGSTDYLHGHDHLIDETAGLTDRWDIALKEQVSAARTAFEIQVAAGTRGQLSGGFWHGLAATTLASIILRFPESLDSDSFRRYALQMLIRACAAGKGGNTRTMLKALMLTVRPDRPAQFAPLLEIFDRYDVVHFTGVNGIRLLNFLDPFLFKSEPLGWDVEALRRGGLKIVYSNIGCLDGVSQTSFAKWSTPPVCDICKWRNVPEVCSDAKNLAWGRLRNHVSHYQVNIGGNRADLNLDPRVHEEPEFYCLDPQVWDPKIEIPSQYRLPDEPGVVRIYHAVGNFKERTDEGNINIKTTHIILPTIQRLKKDGLPVREVFVSGVPNRDVRFIQAQCDIFVDMLTFGFFGANLREAMMLGKVAVCYLRPHWLNLMRQEIPSYVEELPVVSATPETVYDVLADLVRNPDKRAEIGRRSRAFAKKWHSSGVAATRLAQIYTALLQERTDAPRLDDRR